MNITWLGQSGYLLKYKGYRLLIDPYLSNIVYEKQGLLRLIPAPLSVEELRPDALLISHDHMDHFDPETVAGIHRRFPDCRIAGPESVMVHARKLGVAGAALVPLKAGDEVSFGAMRVRPTPAFHSDPFAVGFLIETEETLLYMTGDTLLEETLAADVMALAGRPVDGVFTVINGRLGNMNWQEAAQLVTALRPAFAVPMHYGMFAENTENPADFIESCQSQKINAGELIPGKETEL